MTSKPAYDYAWAESGSTSNPGDPKIQAGWGAELPTAEVFNWILNRIDEAVKHLFENGVAQWDDATDYTEGALTLYSGVLYRSLQTPNVDQTPGAAPTYWQVALTEDIAAALAGTVGTPGAANKFVTNDDPRVGSRIGMWVSFNASSGAPVIGNSYNVDSITRNGVGDYTINFTDDAPDANYAVSVGLGKLASGRGCAHNIVSKTVSAVRVQTKYEQDEGSGNWSPEDFEEISVSLIW
jgi:hypothetical protein